MSKHFTLFISIFNIAIAAGAQVGKGSTFLGGDFGGQFQEIEWQNQGKTTHTGLTISPVFGKAVKENLILGLDASIGLYDNGDNPTNSSESYGAGIFVRKYKPIGSGFNIFLQARLGASTFQQTSENPPATVHTEYDRFHIGVNAYPGISYALNKKLHLETGFNNLVYINYYTEKREENGISSNNYKAKGVSLGSSINNMNSFYFGFRLLLSKQATPPQANQD